MSVMDLATRFHLTVITITMLLVKDACGKGYCSFPAFMWTPLVDGGGGAERKWIGRTEYGDPLAEWDVQEEVVAHETELIIRHKVKIPCDVHQRASGQHCYRLAAITELICLQEEVGGKFRVQRRTANTATFSCMRFVQRGGAGVIQIQQAPDNTVNEDRLCYDESLVRQEWLLIGEWSPAWSFCPLVGGFDFGLYEGPKRERVCGAVWRPSRLEAECVKGEGLNFFFPDKQCSPFKDKIAGQNRFECFASWTEGQFLFIMFGKLKDFPRYVLRVPREIGLHDELGATLYLSPVAPLGEDGQPQARIYHAHLKLLRSAPGACYDESDQCRQFAAEDKCTTRALQQYANYCKKSCGLCDFAPHSEAECKYPDNFVGDWVLFSKSSREEITIEPGTIHFSTIGTFICKSKHWEFDYYKALSVFTNGCRPRYSCIHLYKGGGAGETVSFQLSRSGLSDEGFGLCLFMDDPEPLGDRIRSAQTKILLPMRSMFLGTCGLGGIVEVQAMFADGTTCIGEMSDVHQFTCDPRSSLSLDLSTNCNHFKNTDYLCSAYTRLPTGSNFLVTAHREGAQDYVCWVVDMYSDLSAPKGYHGTFTAARCDTGFKISDPASKDRILELTLNKDYDKPCGRIQDEARYHVDGHNEPPVQVFKPPSATNDIINEQHTDQGSAEVKSRTHRKGSQPRSMTVSSSAPRSASLGSWGYVVIGAVVKRLCSDQISWSREGLGSLGVWMWIRYVLGVCSL